MSNDDRIIEDIKLQESQSHDLSSENKLETKPEPASKLSFWQILRSVFAAAIGVQSEKNRQQDFNAKNSMYVYIVAGVIFTIGFVLTLALAVRLVIANI